MLNKRSINKAVSIFFILAAVCGFLAFTGCSSSNDTQLVNNTIQQALDSYKARNFTEFNKYLSESSSTVDHVTKNMTDAVIASFANINYSIKDSSVNGQNATAVVEIDALYFPNILQVYLNESINFQLNSEITDEKEMKKAVDQMLDDMVSDPEAPRSVVELTVSLIKTGGKWKIVPDKEFSNALCGFMNSGPTNI